MDDQGGPDLNNIDINDQIKEGALDESNDPQEGDNDLYAGFIHNGVEVVNVKAIPKDKGIPVKNRSTWDKIS